MSKRKKQVLLFSAMIMLSWTAAAEYVGVAPGVKDLGTVERGQTYKAEFYLVTDIDDTFQVNPEFKRPNPQIYMEDQSSRRYSFIPEESSQERIEDWIRFPRETFNVDPSTSKAVSLTGGGVANARGTVEFYLDVPEDAEPGYHAGAINVNPSLQTEADGGAAVTTLGLSQLVFVFRVPGTAERSMRIMEVNALRSTNGEARIDYLVKNNGTTTVRINRGDTHLFNKFGNQTGTLTYGGQYIEPGETKVIKNYWQKPDIESGEYRVRGEMNYITGQSFIDETVNISEYVQIRPSQEGGEGEKETLPWWLVLMILVLLGAVMYVLEIDPFWIILLIGFAAISAFILMSGLPIYLIPILLIAAVGILYVV